MREFALHTISFILIFCLFIIGGEISIRVYNHIKHTRHTSSSTITLDEELGWRPVANYIFNGVKVDAGGKKYSVTIRTNSDGFRIFGNPKEKKKKRVLFLGDSFTHAMEVSNSKTYYGILKNILSIEVFAFGCGGYGTLQEYMILDKYIDKIRPNIIVLQFCSNDFINNYYPLEVRSTRNNNGMRRPYLTNNGIVYRIPKKASAIRNFANKYSQFLYFIISRIDRINAAYANTVEDVIKEKGVSYPLYSQSVKITEQLIKNIKLRIPSRTRVYAFSVDANNPYYDEFKRISKENEIQFIDGVPQAISIKEQEGITTRAEDGAHWNETGHQIAANVLGRYLKENW